MKRIVLEKMQQRAPRHDFGQEQPRKHAQRLDRSGRGCKLIRKDCAKDQAYSYRRASLYEDSGGLGPSFVGLRRDATKKTRQGGIE